MFSSVLIAVHGVTATSSSGSRNLNVCTQPVDRISEAQVVTAFIHGLIGFAWRLGRSMFLISFVSFVSVVVQLFTRHVQAAASRPHPSPPAGSRRAPRSAVPGARDRARCCRAHRYSVASSHLPQVG